MVYFLAAGFFFAAGFFVVVFLAAGFFFAADFFVVVFLAADFFFTTDCSEDFSETLLFSTLSSTLFVATTFFFHF